MKSIFRTSIIFIILVGWSIAAEERTTIPIGDSPRQGPENAPVTMIEFIDFQ